MITKVDAITAVHTSLVPAIDASLGVLPLSICLVIFSKTTIASSTTIPIAIVIADKEITFNVSLAKNR